MFILLVNYIHPLHAQFDQRGPHVLFQSMGAKIISQMLKCLVNAIQVSWEELSAFFFWTLLPFIF